MIIYLTYNDAPSGIFSSQVIDVVNFLNKEFNSHVKLVSFISMRDYFTSRNKIKNELPEAIVLPMFPGVNNWKINRYLLNLLVFVMRPKAIIGRSVIATQLALKVKKNRIKNVVYDGRGAISAEWKEYQVITDPAMLAEIFELEKEVINESNYRISVSNELITYWKKRFNYDSNNHVVIPCTLNHSYEKVVVNDEAIQQARKLLDFKIGDLVFVYSGSTAGWQSFDLINHFMKPIMVASPNAKLLFLSDKDSKIEQLQRSYPGRVFCEKVESKKVPAYLIAADYGLLTRENSITNQVASPVKFAEYLACGLPVIISSQLGDYSNFVCEKKCGYLMNSFLVEPIDKECINKIAMEHFTKHSYLDKYERLIQFINE